MLSIRTKRAFTLIELLVVIIIIAVMTSILVPAYGRYLEKARFDSVIHEVQDAFAYAREKAVANDTTVMLSYDPQSETFIATVTPPPPPTDQPTALLTGPNGEAVTDTGVETPYTVQLDPQYTITNFTTGAQTSGNNAGPNTRQGNAPQINFKGDGTCDGAAFTLTSSAGRSASFTLLPASGRLIVENNQGQNP